MGTHHSPRKPGPTFCEQCRVREVGMGSRVLQEGFCPRMQKQMVKNSRRRC